MTIEDAGRLLLIIADFVQNYKPSRRIAKSWQRVLGNMDYTDAERYFYEHFSQNKKPQAPMPAEIIERARAEFNPDAIVPLDPPDDLRGAVSGC